MAVILAGFFIFRASIVKADAYPVGPSDDTPYYAQLHVKTSLRNGDMDKALRLDLLPMVKSLATGTIPGDKFTWKFEDAVFYVDDQDETVVKSNFEDWASNYIESPDALASQCNEYSVGLFSLYSLNYVTEVREINDNSGNKVYRCVLTGISVKDWYSPHGKICSRQEALAYYNKCQKQIQMIVSKIKKAKQSNGKPLTNEQKLKWVHDWLINSVDYADEELKRTRKEPSGPPFAYLYIWNEYGAIIEGRSVCEGYSKAFKAIVDELVSQTGAKIECEIVDCGVHAWNRVKLNGKWYHVDVTNDDTGEPDFFWDDIETNFFLVSDAALTEQEHPGGEDGYYANNLEKATDRRYEKQRWPRYKKDLSEYTVELKEPDKVYAYATKTIIPSVIVRYGSNMIPTDAYQVVRTDKNKIGAAKIKVIPAKDCRALNGSIKGPSFKIVKGKISGTAKSIKQYKLGKSKSVCPFNKTFKPFVNTYKYTKRSTNIKVNKRLILKNGTDYTVKYKNNKKKGWAKATITLKGNYTGKITIKYKIVK